MLLLVLPLILAVCDPHELSCPVAEDIAPCRCRARPLYDYDIGNALYLDCSDVTSEDQLAEIFAGNIPFKDVREFTIIYNYALKVLRSGVFGNVTFEIITINTVLEEVQEGALSGSFDTAETINLGWNNLSSFPIIELERFSYLGHIDFTRNNIQNFPSLKSSTLSSINFDHNPLINLPATALRDLPNLRTCTFSHTGISHIEPGTFTGLPKLVVITLNDNNIQHLPTGAIQLNDNLTTRKYPAIINLSNNRISSIEVGAVTGIKQGRIILSNNLLEELDEAVLRPLVDDGTFLNLDGNPLKCGCDIAWLITNQVYMDQLTGDDYMYKEDTCHDGTKLGDLDPQFYKQNC